MKLLDDSIKEVESRQQKAKLDHVKNSYADYRRILREIAGSVYSLVGKMRVDKVLDPPEMKDLALLVDTGLSIASIERAEGEF
jgi:hypothetical protein